MSFEEAPMDIDMFLRRMQEKADARLPDGQFAEYCGRIAFSALEQVAAVPRADAPEIVDTVMQNTPWGAPNAPRQIVNQVHTPSSLFNRALLGCLDDPAAVESGQLFNQLGGYIQELPVDILNAQPVERLVWMQKATTLIQAYELVKQKEYFDQRAFAQTTTTAEMQAFAEALIARVHHTKEIIIAAQGSDVLAIMELIDASNMLDETLQTSFKSNQIKAKRLRQQRGIPEDLYEIMSEARSHATTEGTMDLKYLLVDQPLQQKLEEFQVNWTWQDINQVLGAFPSFASYETQVLVIDALEDAVESPLEDVIAGDELATDGLAALIHHDIYKNAGPTSLVLSIILDKNEGDLQTSFGDITLPREMAPTTTVALLTDIARALPAEDFTAVLERMQEVICGKQRSVHTTTNEWLVTLALLRKCSDEAVREQVDLFIARADFPHTAFRQVITGQKPGSIYLMPGGKIRVDTQLGRGWTLATSSFVAPVDPEKPVPSKTEPQRHSSPEKGVVAAPGRQLTKRERKRAQLPPGEAETVPTEERRVPVIVVPPGESLESLGREISPGDLAIVAQAIRENQEQGRHPLASLRRRTAEGALLCKMRVNGKDGGIRVILTHVGSNQFEIQTIKYRGAVYKDTLFE